MPRATAEQQARFARALAMRDNGYTYAMIARHFGLNSPSNARSLVNSGLRYAGRANEIQSRTVTINSGRTTRTMNINNMQGFTTLQHDYTFGIELEVVGMNTTTAARTLITGGYECRDAGYTHATMPTWKVVSDGSVHGRGGSAEVVSPVLKGNDGLAEVRSVAAVLRDAGARVNQSCGMHIHIGADTLSRDHQARIIRGHAHWQMAFAGMLLERRINNTWAHLRSPRRAIELANAWVCGNEREVRNLAGHQDRYYALNVCAYQRHGTFEIRSHHGSLNGKNATAWIAFHTAFFEACKTKSWTQESMGDVLQFDYDALGGSTDARYGEMRTRDQLANGMTIARPLQVQACKQLAAMLCAEGLLDAATAEYIIGRAGNIAATGRNS